MRTPASAVVGFLAVLFGAPGCANAHDTGEALVAAGSLVALASSEAATRHGMCTQAGCAGQTSKRAAQAAAGVAAGVAIAAVGAALESEDSGDSVTPRAQPTPAAGNWRLVRQPDAPEEEPPAYYIEE